MALLSKKRKLFLKTYKLFVFLLIIIFIFSIGCSNQEEDNPNNIEYSHDELAYLNILMPVNDFKPRYENVENWEKMIKDNYDVDIKLTYISEIDYAKYYSSDYIEKVINDGFEGLIFLWGDTEKKIYQLKEDNLIIQLTSYLENNSTYKQMPAPMKESYTINGEIWSLPVMYRIIPIARVIKSDWLDQLNLTIPTTINEFYNVSRAFTYDDPNNSGNDNTFGIAVKKYMELTNLGDLFLANGVYFEQLGDSTIGFDRITNSYEDGFLKEGAKDTLNLIAKMVDENIIKSVAYNNMYGFYETENEGSFQYTVNSIYDLDKNKIIWYLKGSNDENLCTAYTGGSSYIMSINTKNPQEVLNTFIDTFYGSAKGYYNAYLGIEGIDYEIDGKKLIRINEISSIRVLEEYSPYLMTDDYSYVNESNINRFPNQNYLSSEAEMLSTKNLLFFSSFMGEPDRVILSYNANSLIRRIIGKEASVDDLLYEYIEYMKKNNIQEIIDNKNSDIGKSTTFKY